jgi:desulfoferrodoxin (superoxide reductase-like protein)
MCVFQSGDVQVSLCKSLWGTYPLLTIGYCTMYYYNSTKSDLHITNSLTTAFAEPALTFHVSVFLCLGHSICNLHNVWDLYTHLLTSRLYCDQQALHYVDITIHLFSFICNLHNVWDLYTHLLTYRLYCDQQALHYVDNTIHCYLFCGFITVIVTLQVTPLQPMYLK